MQYFRPRAERSYFGDAMPFFDGDRFHLYYLPAVYDAAGTMQGHDWAHLSTADLRTWEEHPLALERGRHPSFGTGSVYLHEGRRYAFYSASVRGSRNSIVGLAVGDDGGRFRDEEKASFPGEADIVANGYVPWQYRDPCVFRDPATGLFHMLVTSARRNGWDGSLYPFGGCLAHLTSPDLLNWSLHAPFHIPGRKGAPECPDHFAWNGWYYLLFSHNGATHYCMSRTPLGPWQVPEHAALTTEMERVMKTAAFRGNRRIGVSFVPVVEPAGPRYGGRAVFRELVQMSDGTLGTTFPEEMRMPSHSPLFGPVATTLAADGTFQSMHLGCASGRCTLRMQVEPLGPCESYGLLLMGKDIGEALELAFVPGENRIELRDTMKRWPYCRGYTLNHVRAHFSLLRPFELTVVLREDLVDVNLDGRQCFLTAFPPFENSGACFAFGLNASVAFHSVTAVASDAHAGLSG